MPSSSEALSRTAQMMQAIQARMPPRTIASIVPQTPPPYALVALAEPVLDHSGATLGHRIAEVADAKFPVAPGLEWHSVAPIVTAGGFYWDGAQAVPMPAAPPPVISQPGALPTKLA